MGQASGAIIASAIAFSAFHGSGPLDIICTCMVLLVLGSALVMLSNNNLENGWGIVRPGENTSSTPLLEAACATIAREYDLTSREIEILQFLARGRNKSAISEELVLSPNTVKTHTRNIYMKLSIHSQQELIDLVEREQHQLSNEGIDATALAF